MKNIVAFSFNLSILLVILFVTNAFPENWRVTTLDSSQQNNSRMNITLDEASYPHIVYGEKNIDYVYLDEQGWHHEQVATFPEVGLRSPAIAVDENGYTHIAYIGEASSQLIYTTNRTGEWSFETLGIYSTEPVIAVDSENTPHIFAYPNYAHKASGAWFTESIDGADDDSGFVIKPTDNTNREDFKIVLDATDKAHIVYALYTEVPYAGENAAVEYASNKSGDWVIETISDESLYDYLRISQLFIDAEQTVHLIFQTRKNWNGYPGTCYGDCHYIIFKHAYSSINSWVLEEIATTNHYSEVDNTVPPGTPQYFGVSRQSPSPQYLYLFDSEYGYESESVLSHTVYSPTDSILTSQIDTRNGSHGRLASIQDASDALHIFFYNYSSDSFKYATNSNMFRGDVNLDYVINLQDAIFALQLLTGSSAENTSTTFTTVTTEMKIGLEDVIYVLQKITER